MRVPLALFLATTSLAGQNLVKNGDFETGTTGWTFSGFTQLPAVIRYNTSGTAVSNCFSNRPGSRANTTPPGGCYTMQQTVPLLRSVEHVLTADLCIANTTPLANVHAGNFEFWFDGKLIKRVKYNGIRSKEVFRRQVCIRFTPTTSGNKVMQVRFCRDWGARTLTPRLQIDNIVLLRVPKHPLICPRGERKVASTIRVDFYGTKSAQFVVYGSPATTKGVRLPGFLGTWLLALPPQSVLAVSSRFSNTGTFQLNLKLPASSAALAGLPLNWQAIEANPRLQIGTIARFGFYR